MGAEGDPLEEAILSVVKTVLLELTTGRQATAAGHERFSRLADLFVAQQVQRGFTKMLPPQDSLESMKAFISWMVLDQDRAREFETVMRQAAGFLVATARPPLMKDSGIKAMIKELVDTSGSKAQPMTIGTTRMLRAAIHEVIPRLWADQPMIQARETVNLINEAVGALRVGESCNGGGEGYGLDANNTMIQ